MNMTSSPEERHSAAELPLLLVVDDDPLFQKQVELIVVGHYQVETSLQALSINSFALTKADTIILDLNMPGIDGISFIKTVATLSPKPKVLIASGHDESILELARNTAAMYGLNRTEVLQKPISRASLLRSLANLDRMPTTARIRSALVQTFSEDEILAGFKAGQFRVVYQPQVSIRTGAIFGLEALARWDHPEYGCLSPAHFIETIEDSDNAEAFTLAIAEIAARDVRALEKEHNHEIKISVNVPPQVLDSETFIDELMACLNRHGVAPERFQCEITERGLENHGPAVSSSLARLRMKGILLSIDDFGVGQSGLSKVKSRAFDEIKIDRSFISDLANSADSRSIVESIMQLSRSIGLRVVAEGIEDARTLKHCRLLGIDIAQGYFFSVPLSLAKLQTWLTDRQQRDNNSGRADQ